MINSALFYDERNPGQGDRFLKAVEATEAAICKQPLWGKAGHAGTRTWRIKNFPFAMIYKEFPDRITVFAIAHFSRNPGYWTERL
jgi:hypothetical protein